MTQENWALLVWWMTIILAIVLEFDQEFFILFGGIDIQNPIREKRINVSNFKCRAVQKVM